MSMKPLTSTLLLFALLLCTACGQSAAKEMAGTESPVPDTSAIIATVERNLATMDEMPPDNIEDDTLPENLAQQLRLFFSCASIEEINHFQYTYTPVFQRETIFREGVFIDQSEDKTVMSNAIKNLIQTRGKEGADASYLKKDLAFYKKMEKNSLRIVITDKKSPTVGGETRIFHFHEKNGRLYLFLIDFYSIDGSV
ncbi:MAG: hypothetical protein IJP65_03055 [Bacteroidales bacterium]|nr:hypothetical protein [Bacteroidales bacterium]MBR0054267.1 hypothetical protein [Bacteroidales bacterium]